MPWKRPRPGAAHSEYPSAWVQNLSGPIAPRLARPKRRLNCLLVQRLPRHLFEDDDADDLCDGLKLERFTRSCVLMLLAVTAVFWVPFASLIVWWITS